MKLVFATNNAHKLSEVRSMIGDAIEIVSLSEIGCFEEIPETADTLEGNALLKARYVYERYGLSCFADDTGLEITALNGAPGVYSARYAGEPQDAAANRAKVLRNLQGEHDRSAQFRTVMALILDGQEYSFDGVVKGEMTTAERGVNGFGYDAIFAPEGYEYTFAELDAEVKNEISHRARAVKRFCAWLDENITR